MVPEVWLCVAERTGIDALRVTTRDIPDYDQLMRHRISIINENGLGLAEIQEIIGGMTPLPGAVEFLNWLRERSQVFILSDTFYQFATPLMRQLQWPTLFCNYLLIDDHGRIEGYRLRQDDQKRQAVKALRQLEFKIIAAGDSYNDTSMLKEADRGILFCPPDHVAEQFPQFPVTSDYAQLRAAFIDAAAALAAGA